MPLGYVPGSHKGLRNAVSHRIFGSRKFSRTIEYKIFRRWLPDQPAQVLDVGAGGGELAHQMALMGHTVTALDFDLGAIKEARSPSVAGVELTVGDATRLPFEDSRFDMVVCNSALEHFPDDERAISEMARVVQKGGTVLVTTDSFPPQTSPFLKLIPSSWRSEGLKDSNNLSSDMQDYHRKKCYVVNYYEAERLVGKFQKHGLEVREWRYYLNGHVSKAIYELHILLKWFDFYNKTSRRMFPLFYPFTYIGSGQPRGYGLAIKAVKNSE